MANNGKLVIGAIFFVAVAAAVSSMVVRYQATRRILQFWGTETVALVSAAPEVEVLRFDSAGRENGVANPDIANPDIAERIDISRARGLVHLRQALLGDRSFAWDERVEPGELVWAYGLQFRDATSSVTLKFTADFRRASQSDSPEIISTAPIADGLATLFAEHLDLNSN